MSFRHLATAALTCATLALTGCIPDSDQASPQVTPAESPAPPGLGHVHGLGVDPGDEILYVASHYGIFRVPHDGDPEQVAGRWQDSMGFAVVGPRHFLASGHPDLREDLPAHLGLIESTDAAESWTPLSMQGEADFHAIEPVGDRVYAYDSQTSALMVTTDRREWTTVQRNLVVLDLAANPARPDTVYATTGRGVLVRSEHRGAVQPVAGAPTLTAIDWEPDGTLVGVTPTGKVVTWRGGIDWQRVGTLDGPVHAFDAIPGRWHAATDSGVHESTDGGATWRAVLTATD